MTKEIEIEAKNLVTKDEFVHLCSSFQLKKQDFHVQHNHYFDTAHFDLKEKQSALRIREKQHKFVLTLKQPHEVGKLETHQSIDKQTMDHTLATGIIPNGDVANQLRELGVTTNTFTLLGTLTTSRAEIDYKGGTLVFDESSYLSIVDYELEYEGEEEEKVETTFGALLKEFNIPKRDTDNKIARFFKAKAEQS